jgi:hypothetical protein
MLEGHVGTVRAVAFLPGSDRIITGGLDRTAKVWDSGTGRDLLTLRGHMDVVNTIHITMDGSRIYTGSADGSVRIWQAATEEELSVLSEAEQQVSEQLSELRIRRSRSAEKEAADRASGEGAITDWLVLAPIPFQSGQDSVDALYTEQIREENRIRPQEGESTNNGELRLRWHSVELQDYVLDFCERIGRPAENCVGYAVSYLYVPHSIGGLTMRLASDDLCRVYLNGTEVYTNTEGRGLTLDEDTIEGLELDQGINVLVFKVVNEASSWQGAIRFTHDDGAPVSELKVAHHEADLPPQRP